MAGITEIDKDVITKLLVESLAVSSIGDAIKKAIDASIQSMTVDRHGYGREKPVLQGAVDLAVAEATRKIIQEEMKDEILEMVRAQLTPEKLKELVAELVANVHIEYKGSRF